MADRIFPRPAIDRGTLMHQVGEVQFAEFHRAVCARTAAEAEHDAERAEALESQLKAKHEAPDVSLRRCDDCALNLGRDVLRALGRCPRWAMVRAGIESRCAAFVAKDGAQ